MLLLTCYVGNDGMVAQLGPLVVGFRHLPGVWCGGWGHTWWNGVRPHPDSRASFGGVHLARWGLVDVVKLLHVEMMGEA